MNWDLHSFPLIGRHQGRRADCCGAAYSFSKP